MHHPPEGRVRPLTPDDIPALIRIRQASFGTPRDPVPPDVLAIFRRRLPHLRGIEVGGRLVAACTWYPKATWIGGVHVRMSGLASVVSAPESRRRGHVRTLIAAGLRELHETGVGWVGEHPFDPAFYDRLGFRVVPSSVPLRLPFARLPGAARDVAFAPTTITDPDVHAIHRAFASSRSFALDRNDPPGFEVDAAGIDTRWSNLLDPPNARSTPGTVYRSQDAYAIVAVEDDDHEGILDVIDVAWRTPTGRAEALALLHAWDAQAGLVRLELPYDDPLARRDASEWSRPRTPLQLRINDVPAALTPLRGADADVTLAIRDDLAPWNAGSWRLESHASGCRVTPTHRPSNATLDVGALTALLAGTPPAALLASGEAEGSLAALRAVHALTLDHPPYLGLADYY
jgi:predicted acetyltransferase